MNEITHMRAIVLAAGMGKRMRPLTDYMPKPMVKVAGKCLVDYALDFIGSAGIKEAVVNTHYMAPLLEAHLKTRTTPPHIQLSYEETLLETGGGILKALPMLGDQSFFSVNSDTICVNGPGEHALHRLLAHWDASRMDALLLVHPVDQAVGYDSDGDFLLGQEGELIRRQEGTRAPYVFTGIQIMHPRLFANAPDGPFSLTLLYARSMQSGGGSPRIFGLVHDGKWLHVGDPKAIPLAQAALSY